MQDISMYFAPISAELEAISGEGTLGEKMVKNDSSGFPEIQNKSVALIYVPEYRRLTGSNGATNESFRKSLYTLYAGDVWIRQIYDLGTIRPGETIQDTYYALTQVVTELAKAQVIPIVIGGGQDLTLACYKGFEPLEQMVNICSIDHSLDIGDPNEDPTAHGYVSHLLMQRPCNLFNFANIGMQRPKVKKKEIELFEKLYFDFCRLGEFMDDFKKAEPHLRNSDILSIDFGSIKGVESDPSVYSQPNGFSASQICQLSKYAGISDKLACFGVFNVDPNHNKNAAALLAEMIWYFLDGVHTRMGDFPIGSKIDYKKFIVHLDDFQDDLIFYKSPKSGRWWMEVKYPMNEGSKYERHHLVPCDEQDYHNTLENDVPDLWWKTLQKLS
ncbi:MAG: formimidoylglutamase [Crocinitomicaceae bacterium]